MTHNDTNGHENIMTWHIAGNPQVYLQQATRNGPHIVIILCTYLLGVGATPGKVAVPRTTTMDIGHKKPGRLNCTFECFTTCRYSCVSGYFSKIFFGSIKQIQCPAASACTLPSVVRSRSPGPPFFAKIQNSLARPCYTGSCTTL